MHCSNLGERTRDLDQISSKGEMRLDCEKILNVEPAEFPDGLYMGWQRGGARMTLFFGERQEGQKCHYLR